MLEYRTNHWYLDIDWGKLAAIILIGLKKAFHTVNHHIPLGKMSQALELLKYVKRFLYESAIRNMCLNTIKSNLSYAAQFLGCCSETTLSTKAQVGLNSLALEASFLHVEN